MIYSLPTKMLLLNVKAVLDRDMIKGACISKSSVLGVCDDAKTPYAILSHRWQDEVDYDEMTNLMKMEKGEREEVRRRNGYKKILASCEQVMKGDLDWLHTVLRVMDSDVRHLCIDIAGVSDDVAMSYEFLRREYVLERITERNDLSVGSVYPRGPLLVCRATSVREFVEQFPYLTLKAIKSIAEYHGLFLRQHLRRLVCMDALRAKNCKVRTVPCTGASTCGFIREKSRRCQGYSEGGNAGPTAAHNNGWTSAI
ncbi:hypothetical protein BKA82DRAFT_35218 [Pisolithus tinctorius]|uniref:Uncharacterized protein n=1 Tax=Pisolithus tinctorius Marx 270 TaxID=870435 RepID=A0A0C3NFK3_PISTI|nr:hypothetical protein BKA82DRAFT_35218 [Pisolithus tinctorius]KIN94278.1 hypothetical protein M404DRAFT_35218 [Pisolithus tinctorius Marx 270]